MLNATVGISGLRSPLKPLVHHCTIGLGEIKKALNWTHHDAERRKSLGQRKLLQIFPHLEMTAIIIRVRPHLHSRFFRTVGRILHVFYVQ